MEKSDVSMQNVLAFGQQPEPGQSGIFILDNTACREHNVVGE